MSNSYTQFSAELTGLSKEEADYAKKLLAIIDDETEIPDELEDTVSAIFDEGVIEDCGFCDWEIEEDSSDPDVYRCYSIWFHTDEGGNPDGVAAFVKHLLDKFDRNEVWFLSWARTCSKPQLDSFYGGRLAVSRNKIREMGEESDTDITEDMTTDVRAKLIKQVLAAIDCNVIHSEQVIRDLAEVAPLSELRKLVQ